MADKSAENIEVVRQQNPQLQTRPQSDQERAPDPYRVTLEKEGRSEWSGGWAGGRSR